MILMSRDVYKAAIEDLKSQGFEISDPIPLEGKTTEGWKEVRLCYCNEKAFYLLLKPHRKGIMAKTVEA
ncbi:MAG TPA: hypothetical protein VH593_26590 [Ktedonobacteraceae bacterium]|jgi:hypothetical protein